MDVGTFVSTYLPYAQQVSAQTGLPVDFVLGQAAYETGWGTSNAASNNNFFGISPGGNLASYSDVDSGFSAY
jgi:flagellum-specific peptidoglycan hydrolase FlgJ